MDDPAGAQEPVIDPTVQPVVPPVDAATVPPEAPLPPDNVIDDDDYPTAEQMAQIAKLKVDFTPPTEAPAAAPVPPPASATPPVAPPVPADPEQGLPGFRLKPRDQQEERVYRLLKADPNMTLAEATAFVYRTPQQAPAADGTPNTEATPPAPAAPSSNAIKDQILELTRKMQAEPWADDAAETAALLEEKRLEYTKAVTEEAISARDAKLTEQQQIEAARDQEWNGCVTRWPHLKVAGNAHAKEAEGILDAWQATNDPRLGHPNLNTIVLEAAALALIEKGQWQQPHPPASAAPAAPVAQPPVPVPVTTRFNPPGNAAVAPPSVAPQRLTADQAEEWMESDPAGYRRYVEALRK